MMYATNQLTSNPVATKLQNRFVGVRGPSVPAALTLQPTPYV